MGDNNDLKKPPLSTDAEIDRAAMQVVMSHAVSEAAKKTEAYRRARRVLELLAAADRIIEGSGSRSSYQKRDDMLDQAAALARNILADEKNLLGDDNV